MNVFGMALRAVHDDLRIHTLRTLLTLFGLALGSGSLVVLGWLLPTAEDALGRMTFEATGAHVVSIDGAPHDPWVRVRKEQWIDERDQRALEGPTLSPLATGQATTWTVFRRTASVRRRSLAVAIATGGAEFASLSSYRLVHGRWPVPAEEGERVCVVAADVFRELYPQGWPAEEPLVLDGATSCRVVGALAPKPATHIDGLEPSAHPNRRVFLPTTAFARTMASREENPAQLHLGTEGSPEARAGLVAPVERALVGLHHGAHNFRIGENASAGQVQRLVVLAIEALLVSGTLVATFVGGINVMNAQMVTLGERTREYGVHRALGLSRRALARIVLLESMFLALLGAGVGLATGGLLAYAASRVLEMGFGGWAFAIAPWSVLLAVTSAVLVGTLAGIHPARRAAALLPAECLVAP